jgi:hypothetical protein
MITAPREDQPVEVGRRAREAEHVERHDVERDAGDQQQKAEPHGDRRVDEGAPGLAEAHRIVGVELRAAVAQQRQQPGLVVLLEPLEQVLLGIADALARAGDGRALAPERGIKDDFGQADGAHPAPHRDDRENDRAEQRDGHPQAPARPSPELGDSHHPAHPRQREAPGPVEYDHQPGDEGDARVPGEHALAERLELGVERRPGGSQFEAAGDVDSCGGIGGGIVGHGSCPPAREQSAPAERAAQARSDSPARSSGTG